MQVRSFYWYVLTKPLASGAAISQALAKHPFTPCAPQQLQSQGWSGPIHSEELLYEAHGAQLLMLKQEKRLLPASVINDYLQQKLEAFEADEGYMPGRKVRQQMKEDLTLELLPKAFTKTSSVPVVIFPKQGWLMVIAGSAKTADDTTAFLRETLGSLPVSLMNVDTSPTHTMTNWISAPGELPDDWQLGEEAELQDEDGAMVRVRNQALFSDEMAVHMDAGKRVNKLQLMWKEDLTLMLQEDMSIKRIKLLLEGDDLDVADMQDGPEAKYAHEFAVSCNWLVPMCQSLLAAMGGMDQALAGSIERSKK